MIRDVSRFILFLHGLFCILTYRVSVASTEALFWTMLEAGISVVAVNLPTLWGLVSSIIPETAIRRLCSLFRIQSLHNKPSGYSETSIQLPPVPNEVHVRTYHGKSTTDVHKSPPTGLSHLSK